MTGDESKAIFDLLEQHSYKDIESNVIKLEPKNREAAIAMRMEGNALFQAKNHDFEVHERIWQKYTMSIALAPNESEELALAYANRSALLFHLANYRDSLMDIERAIDLSKTNLFKAKWLCRKAKCLHVLGNLPSAESTLQEAKSCIRRVDGSHPKITKISKFIDDTDIFIKKEFTVNKDEIDKPNISINIKEVNDYSAVTVKHNSKHGRHLIATRDIEPGEVIFIEKPYCASIFHHQGAQSYCTHCYVACLTLIPCENCCWAMYCTEKCKIDAWSYYHDVECSAFGRYNLGTLVPDHLVHTALRVVIKECRQAGSIGNLKEFLNNRNRINDCLNKKSIQNNELEIIYNMGNWKKSNETFLLHLGVSLYTLISLARFSTFFGKTFSVKECKKLASNEEALFVGRLLYKLVSFSGAGMMISNVHHRVKCEPSGVTFDQLIRGASIQVLGSLINHNCDPNADRVSNEHNDVVIFAIQPIKKYEQIFITYKDTFESMTKNERQAILRKVGGFECNCQACRDNWPPIWKTSIELFKDKPGNVFQYLFQNPLEKELFKKHEKLIKFCFEDNILDLKITKDSESDLKELSMSIIKVSSNLPKPSVTNFILTRILCILCLKLYSNSRQISGDCHNN